MGAWQEDNLLQFEQAQDVDTLFDTMTKLAQGLGFEYCTAALRLTSPQTAPKIYITSNYSRRWLKNYHEKDYFSIDPVVDHAMKSQHHLVWDETRFLKTREFYEEACAEGIRYGWSQPCHGPNNTISLLSLARSSEAISASELKEKRFKLAWLAQTAQIGIANLWLPTLMPARDIKLSNREISVLRWVAEGKKSEDIAEILHISKRTVDFHANKAIAKLDANNRTSAAVLATMYGLL